MTRVRKTKALPPETKLAELRAQFETDACMGRLHDPMHVDCVMCAVNLECSTLQGNTNTKLLKQAKGKRSEHLDTSMAISTHNATAAVNLLSISATEVMQQLKEDIEYSLDGGNKMYVTELRDWATQACPDAQALTIVLWLVRFYDFAGFTVEDGCVVRRAKQ